MSLAPGQAYSRMFAGGRHPAFDEAALKELAAAMATSGPDDNSGRISGLVYFGQFLDHDLTRDDTKLSDAADKSPEETRNFRTARFDLDSVYGVGPAGELADPAIAPEDYLYDHSRPGSERFRLGRLDPPAPGRTLSAPFRRSDLPRRRDLTAVLADDRNDENIIIAQFTVLFLKFHNRLLDLLEQDPPLIEHAGGETLFAQAKRLVTWHYQYWVVNQFSATFVLPDVHDEIFQNGGEPRLFRTAPGDVPNMPLEFAMAAFRFGHSMLRPTYRLQADTSKKLGTLLRREPRRLAADEVIDWDFFLGPAPRGKNLAQRINPFLTEALFELPPQAIALFTECPPTEILSLPARTLIRGSRVGLPSAQEACKQAGIPFIDFLKDDPNYELLCRHGMDQRTPLWYYFLHEAWIVGSVYTGPIKLRQCGMFLGPLGSRIVAEVILGLLVADSDSFINATSKWCPPVPKVAYLPSGASEAITELDKLRHFALTTEG